MDPKTNFDKVKQAEHIYKLFKELLQGRNVTSQDFVTTWINHIPDEPIDDSITEIILSPLKRRQIVEDVYAFDEDVTVIEPCDSASQVGALGKKISLFLQRAAERNNNAEADALLKSAKKRNEELFDKPLKKYDKQSRGNSASRKTKLLNSKDDNSTIPESYKRKRIESEEGSLEKQVISSAFITLDESNSHINPQVSTILKRPRKQTTDSCSSKLSSCRKPKSKNSKKSESTNTTKSSKLSLNNTLVPNVTDEVTNDPKVVTTNGYQSEEGRLSKETGSSCYKTALDVVKPVVPSTVLTMRTAGTKPFEAENSNKGEAKGLDYDAMDVYQDQICQIIRDNMSTVSKKTKMTTVSVQTSPPLPGEVPKSSQATTTSISSSSLKRAVGIQEELTPYREDVEISDYIPAQTGSISPDNVDKTITLLQNGVESGESGQQDQTTIRPEKIGNRSNGTVVEQISLPRKNIVRLMQEMNHQSLSDSIFIDLAEVAGACFMQNLLKNAKKVAQKRKSRKICLRDVVEVSNKMFDEEVTKKQALQLLNINDSEAIKSSN